MVVPRSHVCMAARRLLQLQNVPFEIHRVQLLLARRIMRRRLCCRVVSFYLGNYIFVMRAGISRSLDGSNCLTLLPVIGFQVAKRPC